MCKEANKLICKQHRAAQRQYGILEAFMIELILMIFWWLEAMLTKRIHRKSTSTKKIQIKSWYMI